MTDINNTITGATGPDPDHSPDPVADNTPDLTDQVTYLTMLLRRAEMARRHEHHGPGAPGDHAHGPSGPEGPKGHRGHRGHGFAGGIRSGQGRVLGILALQSPLTQKNLAFMLGVRPQSLSELVSKLESKGLVTRSRDDNDRRSFLIDLTDAGRDAAAEIDGFTADDPFAVLSDAERETYSALTAKVIEAVEASFPEDAGLPGPRGPRGPWGPGGPGGRPGFGPGFGPGAGPGHGGPRGHRDHRPHGPGQEPSGPEWDDPEFTDEEFRGMRTHLRGTRIRNSVARGMQDVRDSWGRGQEGRGFRRGTGPRFA